MLCGQLEVYVLFCGYGGVGSVNFLGWVEEPVKTIEIANEEIYEIMLKGVVIDRSLLSELKVL